MCLIFDFTLYMRFIQPDASVLLLFYSVLECPWLVNRSVFNGKGRERE
jgi:hypothetical protein